MYINRVLAVEVFVHKTTSHIMLLMEGLFTPIKLLGFGGKLLESVG